MPQEIVRIESIKKLYKLKGNSFKSRKENLLHAVDGVSLTIFKGQIYGVVGESGSGKSTLGRCILRLTDIDEGSLIFDGEDITNLSHRKLRNIRRRMQMIFQNPYSSFNPKKNIGQALFEVGRVYKISKYELNGRIDKLLEYIGLSGDVLKRYPHELSGGQLQRLAIARALVLDPLFIVADEPVSALDVSVQAQILNLILYLRDIFGLTLLFISHELTVVEQVCDIVAVMYLGTIVEEAPTVELFGNMKHPYTQALISARPKDDPAISVERIFFKGEQPSPINIGKGCRFAGRCPKFVPGICDTETPELKEILPKHYVACHFAIDYSTYEKEAALRQEGYETIAYGI